MTNAATKPERVGTTVDVMCHGHIVKAKIVGTKEVYPGSDAGDPKLVDYVCEFIEHFRTGKTRLCLDFGQNWFINAGETFHASEDNIEAAATWIARG